ncbi:MAG TPA: hypothetical protein VFQ61_23425, partial [Polyangiaceae bacterium]|nr:hypothetical protein [Polyangiaceae bacterium]
MRKFGFPLVATTVSALVWASRAQGQERQLTGAGEIQVMGERPTSPRGAGDLRIDRQQLEASPRQHASELLAAAPGFFVDHEDGEGLGNDVTLRGFDLEHGTGIELRLGSVPINSPIHI